MRGEGAGPSDRDAWRTWLGPDARDLDLLALEEARVWVGDPARWGALAGLGAPHALLDAARALVRWDDAGAAPLRRADAEAALAAGATVYATDLDTPAAHAALAALEEGLALYPFSAEAQGVVAGPGARVRRHYDADYALNLQLAGDKRWWLGGAPAARAPLEGAVAEADLPQGFEVTVGPGATVFVPRGAWHGTEVVGEARSASLVLALRPRMWLELALSALEARLSEDPAWRELAVTLVRPEAEAPAERLEALRRLASTLEPADLLPFPFAQARLRRAPEVTGAVDEDGVRFLGPGTRLRVTGRAAPLAAWIAAREGPLDPVALARAGRALGRRRFVAAVRHLLRAGILEAL